MNEAVLRNYLTNIEPPYKTGSATKHTYRPALQKLLASLVSDILNGSYEVFKTVLEYGNDSIKIRQFDITYGSLLSVLWWLHSPFWATVLYYRYGCSDLTKRLYICIVMKNFILHEKYKALGIDSIVIYRWRNQ
jgi:hypothetical protein